MPPKAKCTKEHIADMLTQDFTAMMMLMKSGKYQQHTIQKLEG